MTKNLPIKFLFLLGFIYTLHLSYGALTAKNMLSSEAACEEAVTDYIKYGTNKFSPEAKVADTEMQTTCKAVGQYGEVYLKSLGFKP